MITESKRFFLTVLLAISITGIIHSQDSTEISNKDLYRKLDFFDLRGTNAIDAAVGSALINGDYPEPEFEIYFRIGYKHHITSNFNIGLTYNRYNIAFDNEFNEGFMSFDLNFEYLISPYNKFSPFLYAGYGYNASSSFESTQPKVQAGLGFEYMVVESVGIKLFGEYNYVLSKELEGLIMPNNDESFIRMGLGVNFYFGGSKRREKLLNSIKTIINSNLIK